MGANPALVSESVDVQLSYSITSYLRKLKKQVAISVSLHSLLNYHYLLAHSLKLHLFIFACELGHYSQ